MKNFLIGQFGGFDDDKFHRDFREEFFGIENCLYETEEDLEKLKHFKGHYDNRICVHFPLRGGRLEMRDPLFTSKDDLMRKFAYASITDELAYCKQLDPYYVLFHYPKPVILSSDVDWTSWAFSNPKEYIEETHYSQGAFLKYSEELFAYLTEQAEQHGFIPVLELDGLNKYILETTCLEALLEKYPRVKLCLDTGRMHLQEKSTGKTTAIELIQRFAKYSELIHLYNLKYNGAIEEAKIPVSPDQKSSEGWADIESYLKAIRAANPEVKILFEHKSHLITSEELERCYTWVDSLMNG